MATSARAHIAAGVTLVFVAGLSLRAQVANEPQMPSIESRKSGSPQTRAIVGKVVDDSGDIVPGAVVLLKDMKSLQVRSFIVLKDGTYHFYGLSTDVPYEVRAQANGMTSASKLISVFNSHNEINVKLKLKEKKTKKNF